MLHLLIGIVALILLGLFWRIILRVVAVLALVCVAVGGCLLFVNGQPLGVLLMVGVAGVTLCAWAIREGHRNNVQLKLEREAATAAAWAEGCERERRAYATGTLDAPMH